MSRALRLFVLGLLAISPVVAQTFTDCDPTQKDCPADLALGISNYTVDFTTALDATVWNTTSGKIVPSSNGSLFTINKRFDSPTIQSKFYIFFGTVEVHMKAALGQGIISSIVLESDDLDEIDWEFMGGNNTHAETNYFGKGNQTTFDRALYHPVATPSDTFHNYTLVWTAEKLQWFIDTKLVRTLNYADANSGHNYPQTPMTVRLGIWAGGDPGLNNGTIEWAGGATDFTKAPYTMYVQSAKIADFSTGQSYSYGDRTGNWQSIKSTVGNSTVATTIAAGPAPTAQTIAEKWAGMNSTAHIAVYSSAGVAAVGAIALIACCCIQRRRRNRKDRAENEARLEELRREDEKYAGMNAKQQDSLSGPAHTPDGFSGTGAEAETARGGPEGYFGKDSESNVSASSLPSVAAPVYSNSGFGSKGYTPSSAASPVYSGSGHGNQSLSPSASIASRSASPRYQSQFGQDIPRVSSPAQQSQFGQSQFGQDVPRVSSPAQQSQYGQSPSRVASPAQRPQYGQMPSRVASPAQQSQYGGSVRSAAPAYSGGFNNGMGNGNQGLNRGMGSQYSQAGRF